MDDDPHPWRLRGDLVVTHALLWIAGVGARGEPVPGVHLYLYDRYWRLGEFHQRRGRRPRAARLFKKAEDHYRRSGGVGPPPRAVAMAMPRPRPLSFTDAVARRRAGRDRGPLRPV